MKKLRKLTALLLAFVMVFSLGVSAVADENWQTPTDYTITITNNTDKIEHTYKAYQIFKGDVVYDANAGEPVVYYLSNIEWGASVDTTKTVDSKTLLKALYDLEIGTGSSKTTPFKTAFDAIYQEQKNALPSGFADFASNGVDITADDVASVLGEEAGNDDELARKFADIVAKYLKSSATVQYGDNNANSVTYPVTGVKQEKTQETAPDTYKIDVKLPGYYIVKDETEGNLFGDGAYSDYILEVVGPVDATAKSSVPSVDKKIKGADNSEVKNNTASIGDKIDYILYGNLPSSDELSRYEKYTLKFVDTLSKGLTYDSTTGVTVTLQYTTSENLDSATWSAFANLTVRKDTDYTVESTSVEGSPNTVTVTVKDLIALIKSALTSDTTVVKENIKAIRVKVELSATLNEYAEITDAGNENSVKLDYSNDPTWDPNDPEDNPGGNPDAEPPMGETPEEKVVTFTTGLELLKHYLKSGDNTKYPLAGATFKITGTGLNAVVKTVSEFVDWDADGSFTKEGAFNKSAEGYVPAVDDGSATPPTVYYKLTSDGTYVVSTEAGSDTSIYEQDGSSPKKYMKVTYSVKKAGGTSNVEQTVTVGDDGLLQIDGLKPGTYLIEETVAPTGYNKLKNKIAVEIKADWDEATSQYKWSYRTAEVSKSANAEAIQSALAAATWTEYYPAGGKVRVDIDVLNKKGLTLPGTGGMGTYVFYAVGGMMLILALAILIAKNRAYKGK